MDRPSWDEYFLRIALDVSLRSEDLFIKHGCVLVDRNTNHLISIGYNGLIRGMDHNLIDLSNRDLRRPYMLHAEENCILNATQKPLDSLKGAKAYITGTSCNPCLQKLIQFGVKEVIELDSLGTITENEETEIMRATILKAAQMTVKRIDRSSKWLR